MPRGTREDAEARFARFKDLLKAGLPARQAAAKAGYSDRMAHSKAHLLARRAKEESRVRYLPLEWWQRGVRRRWWSPQTAL